MAGLEDVARERTAVNVGPTVDEGVAGEWRPPEREQGLPDAGLVTCGAPTRRGACVRAGCWLGGRMAGPAHRPTQP